LPLGNIMPYVAAGGVWQDFSGPNVKRFSPSGYRLAGGLEFHWTDHF